MKSEYREAAKGAWRIRHTRAVLAASLTELFAKSIRQIKEVDFLGVAPIEILDKFFCESGRSAEDGIEFGGEL